MNEKISDSGLRTAVLSPEDIIYMQRGALTYLAFLDGQELRKVSDAFHSITPTNNPLEYIGVRGSRVVRFRI